LLNGELSLACKHFAAMICEQIIAEQYNFSQLYLLQPEVRARWRIHQEEYKALLPKNQVTARESSCDISLRQSILTCR
jgi:hypothetical protein